MSQYSKEDAIESLRQAYEILEESPSMPQYKELGLSPSVTTIKTRWGWQELKSEIGLKTLDSTCTRGNDIDPKPDDVDLPKDVSWEELSPHMRWYYKNPEEAKSQAADRKKSLRERNREYVQNIKEEKGCSQCGFDEHHSALDFHHPDKKDYSVSKFVAGGYSIDRLEKEIQRCILLCANCHRIHHHA